MLNSFCLSTLFNRQRQAHDWISSTRGADGLPDRDLYADHTNTHTDTHIRVCVNLKGVGRSCFFIHLFICSLTSQHLALLQEAHTLRITHFQVLFLKALRSERGESAGSELLLSSRGSLLLPEVISFTLFLREYSLPFVADWVNSVCDAGDIWSIFNQTTWQIMRLVCVPVLVNGGVALDSKDLFLWGGFIYNLWMQACWPC